MDVPLSKDDALVGGSVRILVPAVAVCPRCRGHGSLADYECWQCQGQGTMAEEYPVEVRYPSGLRRDYLVRLSLDEFGINNLFLAVRFRPTSTL